MKHNFVIGSPVRRLDDFSDTGKIISLADSSAAVEWDRGFAENIDFSEIVLIDEESDKILFAKLQSKIDQANASLEQAFEAIQEIRSLSGYSIYSYREAGKINLSDLEDTMDEIGWSSSSLAC